MNGNGDPIVLVSGARTAIGRFGGAFKDVDAHELGAACIREALARGGVEPDEVDEVVMGQVIPAQPTNSGQLGLRDGDMMLDYLVAHPNTARYISKKMIPSE